MEWISTEDRLPDKYEYVLYLFDNSFTKQKRETIEKHVWVGRYCGCRRWVQGFPDDRIYFDREGKQMDVKEIGKISRNKVTHWMPIPDAPEEINE